MHKAFVQRKKFRWHSLQVQEENRYLLNEMNEQLHETSINWRSLAKFLGISDHRGPKKSSRVTSNLTFDGSGSNTLFGLTLTGLFLKRQCKVTPVIPSWTGWSVGFTSLLWTDLRIFMSTVSTRRGIVSPNASMVVILTCTSFMALKNRHAHAMLPSGTTCTSTVGPACNIKSHKNGVVILTYFSRWKYQFDSCLSFV